jgi:hypothetical protein
MCRASLLPGGKRGKEALSQKRDWLRCCPLSGCASAWGIFYYQLVEILIMFYNIRSLVSDGCPASGGEESPNTLSHWLRSKQRVTPAGWLATVSKGKCHRDYTSSTLCRAKGEKSAGVAQAATAEHRWQQRVAGKPCLVQGRVPSNRKVPLDPDGNVGTR